MASACARALKNCCPTGRKSAWAKCSRSRLKRGDEIFVHRAHPVRAAVRGVRGGLCVRQLARAEAQMRTAAAWRAGVATDPGLQRIVNEDRALVDDALGLFLVVDGLGGHAAGEMAAETAVRAITGHMESAALEGRRDVEENIRRAITEANNQIYLLAQQNEDWNGMACVLTLAVAGEDGVTVGHVGDSRLYLIWNGNLRKLTSDHSPVGEQEEHGELTEGAGGQHRGPTG